MTCHRLPSVLGGSLKSVRFLLTQEGHLMYLGGLGSYTFGKDLPFFLGMMKRSWPSDLVMTGHYAR